MWPEFFLQTLLGLVITEVWDFTVDKIKKVYKEHKDVPENQKTFQSRMYTAIIDAFCKYTGINPDEAQDDVMDFICSTAKEYFDQSYKNKDTTTDALLSAIKTLESRFDNTLLEKKNTEDINKILFISDYIQRYIANDQEFRHIYVIKALDYLRRIGVQIKENQLDLKLFAGEAINKAEHRLAVLIGQNSDRVINEIKQDNKKQTDEIKQDYREQTREQTKVILTAIDKSSQHDNKEEKMSKSEEKLEFKDVKTEYVKKWNERLFLHRRPKDEKLTLKKTYISPLYKIIIPEDEKAEEPNDNLNDKLEEFIYNGKSLLIIGAPGTGKTSIVCYLADKFKNDPDVIILRFSDWSEEEWASYESKRHGSILMKVITNKLGCSEKDLRNKLLILDGFDEIKYYQQDINILKSFLLQIRNVRGFRIIITSRENYIDINELKFQNVLKLYPFNEKKIKDYANLISPEYVKNKNLLSDINKEIYAVPDIEMKKLLNKTSLKQILNKKIISYIDKIATDELIKTIDIINKNGLLHIDKKVHIDKEVYGIPVILYMAIVTGIDITEKTNRCKAYGKIFAFDGGIFDRFATESHEGYDENSTPDISYEKEAFINILCKTAFTMFEYTNTNSINIKQYQQIVDAESPNISVKSKLWYDFPIDNLYEKGNDIVFVHKSIYEYFTAEYIYKQLIRLFKMINNDTNKKCLHFIVNLLSANVLSLEITEYLQFRIKNSEINTKEKLIVLKSLLYELLYYGPTNFVTDICCKNSSINTEQYSPFFCNINIIYRNILILIHCWSPIKTYTSYPIPNYIYSLNTIIEDWDTLTKRNNDSRPEINGFEYDSFVKLLLIYLHHVNFIHWHGLDVFSYSLDLSYIGFFQMKESKWLDFYKYSMFEMTNEFLTAGFIDAKNTFKFLQLYNINFNNSVFYKVEFDHLLIKMTTFSNSTMIYCFISAVEFNYVDFDATTLNAVIIKKSIFNEETFDHTNFYACYFENCDFTETHFLFIKCDKINKFINCTFNNVTFSGTFDNCIFLNCDFKKVKFSDDKSYVYCRNTIFSGSTFSERCELTGGVFTGADFRGVDLDRVIYTHELDDAILD